MRSGLNFLATLFAGTVACVLAGCAHYHDRPLSAGKSRDDFESRSLSDAGLKSFLESHYQAGEWPRRAWDFEALTLAAFYFSPELDVARARWNVTRAGKITAGERPNPTVSFAPGYDTTAAPPWILGLSVDIPVETAGKRGYRLVQAHHLSESARLNIATVAWQVRGRVRRSLLDWQAARETEALLKTQESLQAEVVRLLELQLKAGAISPFETMQARIALDNFRLSLNDARRQSVEARGQLADALGLPVIALEGVSFSFASFSQPLPKLPSKEVRRQAVLNRADLLGALAEYAASQSALQLEIAKQYPDIHLGPGYQLDQTDNKWTLGLSMTLPVLNQNQGAIAEAYARREEAAARFTALQAKVIGEVDRAAAGYQAALEKISTVDALRTKLERQRKSVQAMIDAGELAKFSLTTAQLEINGNALARLDALVKIQQALGQLEDAVQGPLPEILQAMPRRSTEVKETAQP